MLNSLAPFAAHSTLVAAESKLAGGTQMSFSQVMRDMTLTGNVLSADFAQIHR